MVTDKEYLEYPVFCELDYYIQSYKSLSRSVFSFATRGTSSIINIDTYLYSSIQGTLESIRLVLIHGKINDAFALTRKYYDSAIINVYSNLYLQENFSIKNFVVSKINNWLHNKEKLPDYRLMSEYIRKSEKLEAINKLLFSDERYKKTRNRCNDHTHYNFYEYVLLNDSEIYAKNRHEALNSLSEDLKNIFVLHLAYMFFLNNHYMMSSDYVDCLDFGMTPEEDSQYWVAPFVQEIFDSVLKKERPDVVTMIKECSKMQLT